MPNVAMNVDRTSLKKWFKEIKSNYIKLSDDFYLLFDSIVTDKKNRFFASFRLATNLSDTNVCIRFGILQKKMIDRFKKFQTKFLTAYLNSYKVFKVVVPEIINFNSNKTYIIEIRPSKSKYYFKLKGGFDSFIKDLTKLDSNA